MKKRNDHLRVGLFVLGSIGLFLVLVVVAIGSRIGKQEKTYIVHFTETVKGMVVGSPVNFQGVRIGRVADMRFVSGMTEVSIAVDPDKAPIQRQTVASLDRAWVTGQVTVELKGWQKGGDELAEYGVIEAELSPAAVVMQSMPEVVIRATNILEDFAAVAKRLGVLLAEDSPLLEESIALLRELRGTNARVHDQILPRVEKLTLRVDEILPFASRALASFDQLTANADALLADPASRKAIEETSALLAAARQTLPQVARLGRELEVFLRGNRNEIRSALSSFASGMRELQDFARLMQKAPNALLFGYRTTEGKPDPRVAPEHGTPASPSGGKE